MVYRLLVCYHLFRKNYEWKEIWPYSNHFRAYKVLGWSAKCAVEDDFNRTDGWLL